MRCMFICSGLISYILPLFHGNNYIIFISEKSEIFSSYFGKIFLQMKAPYLLNYHYGLTAHYLLVILEMVTFFE